jgi:hypothetical protein
MEALKMKKFLLVSALISLVSLQSVFAESIDMTDLVSAPELETMLFGDSIDNSEEAPQAIDSAIEDFDRHPGNPGRPYPGRPYPGRPGGPGRPGRPYPGRPGYPGYPGRPGARGVVCFAQNGRGQQFQARGWDVRNTQYQAMNECYSVSRRCFEMGCRTSF